MPIKSFRGLIADGSIDTVSLSTNNGSTGYKIVKMEIMANDPTTTDSESIVKVYSIPQTTATKTIDFSDNTLLAAASLDSDRGVKDNPPAIVVFDNVIFNQDIYITHIEETNSQPVNYHIELESMPLSLDENTVATLKDIRNIASQ